MEYLRPLTTLYFLFSSTLVLIVLATLIYDLVLRASWTPFCFLYGIPLYKRRFRIKHLDDFNLLQTHLINSQTSLVDDWKPQSKLETLFVKRARKVQQKELIQFKRLNATTIAYKQMKGKQSERLHGRISLHKEARQIEVVGTFNWISPIMPFLFMVFLMIFPFPLIILGPIFISSTISGQKSRHKSITKQCFYFFKDTKQEVILENSIAVEDDNLLSEEKPIFTKDGKYVRAPSDLI